MGLTASHTVKPAGPELASDPVDRGVLAADLLDHPPARAGRQRGPSRGDTRVLLHERPDPASGLGTPPAPLKPHDPHRPTHRRRIHQPHLNPAVGVRHDPQERHPIDANADSTVIFNPRSW